MESFKERDKLKCRARETFHSNVDEKLNLLLTRSSLNKCPLVLERAFLQISPEHLLLFSLLERKFHAGKNVNDDNLNLKTIQFRQPFNVLSQKISRSGTKGRQETIKKRGNFARVRCRGNFFTLAIKVFRSDKKKEEANERARGKKIILTKKSHYTI